jgi:CubicO group peptidase (beta-lactamase class C family)
MSFWNTGLRHLLDEALVPGAALAIVRGGDLTEFASYGVRHVRRPVPIDEWTVFDAASLSKPVFAYLVLQLVDQDRCRLDSLLGERLPDYIQGDPRSSSITVDHALSHTAGLPNWRSLDYPLRTYFPPGDRFSYSGEGFLYLQRAIEAVTGEQLDALARRLVFEPLDMKRSSFVWEARFQENRAYPHDAFGMPALGYKPAEPNAAWSLQTCAGDYARFLVAVLNGQRLGSETAELWLRPRIHIKHRGIQCLESSQEDIVTGVAWGLGWGLEPVAGTFFQWGDNGPFTAFALGSIRDRTALVAFANGASGLSIMTDIVAQLFSGKRPALEWLDYVGHGAPVRRLLRAALAVGAEAAWPEIEGARLKREDVIFIAQGLNGRGREKEGLWLRERAGAK